MFSADSNALEDRASAIKTNDPNKIKIFKDGFDSHSLKSTYYFPDLLPEIDRNDPNSVIIVKNEYGNIRDDSKPITFGKTYGGGDKFLKKKGYSAERISMINAGWNEMYAHSMLHEKQVRTQMEADGFLRLLFGLKLRTPALANPNSPEWMKAKEMRSAFNAYTQCFGNLNTRAALEVLEEVAKLPVEMQESIVLSNLIHDNIIGLCKADPVVIQTVNNILIKAMRWQDDDYVRHDDVTMEAEMEISHDWFNFVKVPNNADLETVTTALNKVEENRKCQ